LPKYKIVASGDLVVHAYHEAIAEEDVNPVDKANAMRVE
jgi:hypothetical protein